MDKLEQCDVCKGDIEHHVDDTTGKTYWTHGYNAEPILKGQCCNTCYEYVFVLRRKQMKMRDELDMVSKFDTRVTIDSLANMIIHDRRKAVKEGQNA